MPDRINITIVVLGDLGRSPRMQLHALALADTHANVRLVGESGAEVYPSVANHPHIATTTLTAFPLRGKAKRSMAHSVLQVVWQACALLRALLSGPRPEILLMQTPPIIPAFTLCHWVARLRSSRLILDWHNFSYSVLAQRLGEDHWVVRLVKRYEKRIGNSAAAHLCVSARMQQELTQQWKLSNVQVFRDQPGSMFQPMSAQQKLESKQIFLAQETGELPFLVVCPSSWSSDDDFQLLLDALPLLDAQLEQTSNQRRFCFLLTGAGPAKKLTAPLFAQLPLRQITVQTPWLEAAHYPKLVACADLGLSLHRSTSKLDLPMKIADMQGCGLVVCALDYGPCLRDMIQPTVNGLLFNTPTQLVDQLLNLSAAYPLAEPQYLSMEKNVRRQTRYSWVEQWQRLFQPLGLNNSCAPQATDDYVP